MKKYLTFSFFPLLVSQKKITKKFLRCSVLFPFQVFHKNDSKLRSFCLTPKAKVCQWVCFEIAKRKMPEFFSGAHPRSRRNHLTTLLFL